MIKPNISSQEIRGRNIHMSITLGYKEISMRMKICRASVYKIMKKGLHIEETSIKERVHTNLVMKHLMASNEIISPKIKSI